MKDFLFRMNPKRELKRDEISKEINDFYVSEKGKNLNSLELLKCIENEIYSHKYKSNEDYSLIGRKKILTEELEKILNEEDRFEYIKSVCEKDEELLRVLVQFIAEGQSVYPTDVEKTKWINGTTINGKDYSELRKIADRYTLSGIICLEEKNDIIIMIEKIRTDILKRKNNLY